MRRIVNFLTSLAEKPGISATDCVLAVTTLSFDIAGLEIYLPLLHGAKLVIASAQAASDAHRLVHTLEESGATVLQATPVTWRMLLDANWSGRRTLRALCGGEALTRDLSRQLAGRVGELWNLYGPTETTIWSCRHQLSEAAPADHSIEPIGHPIANTQVYVLDPDQQPVPLGAVGEIYIGGEGVARGYLRVGAHGARFIADPLAAVPVRACTAPETWDAGGRTARVPGSQRSSGQDPRRPR